MTESKRDSDALNEAIQQHFRECQKCQAEIERQKDQPNKFGGVAHYCDTYLNMVATYVPPE